MGETPLCKPYRYLPPPKGGVFAPFWSKKGYIDFAHFGLKWGMVNKGTMVVYQRVRRFNSKGIRKKV